jgi:cobalt-zinc-cadmium efflux system outer membrane protein
MWWLLLSAALAAPLTFEQAVAEATERGPAVAAAAAGTEQAVAEARSQAAVQNPTVEAEQLHHEQEVRLAWTAPYAGQAFAQASAARQGAAAAGARGDAARARAALAAGYAFLDLQRAEARAALAEGSLVLAVESRDAARKLLEAGEIGPVDAAAAAGLAARAQVEATSARQAAVQARTALEALLGREPTGDVEPAGWPEVPTPGEIDPQALPEVVAAAREAEEAAALRSLARMELAPAVQLTGGWLRDPDADHQGAIVGVQVEIPVFSPGIQPAKAASAAADRAEAEAEQARLEALARWRSAVREAEVAAAAYEATRVEGLDEALASLSAAFQAGEYSLSDYVTRRDAVLDGLIAGIDARWRRETARLALWDLAGAVPPGGTP